MHVDQGAIDLVPIWSLPAGPNMAHLLEGSPAGYRRAPGRIVRSVLSTRRWLHVAAGRCRHDQGVEGQSDGTAVQDPEKSIALIPVGDGSGG